MYKYKKFFFPDRFIVRSVYKTFSILKKNELSGVKSDLFNKTCFLKYQSLKFVFNEASENY